jgi:signal transduction histidine kinase/CheY-like chemotaxis protein
MSDGFVMFDPDDRLVACNSRYKDFYKISAPFIVPGALFDDIMREGALRGQYPQAQGDIETFVTESKAFHRGNNPPMERLLPDGRWVLITERRTPDGGVVGIRTDITPLKRAMQDLATARDAARAAGEAKSQFLARMSHELRTPLNGILGFSELLLDDTRLQDDQRDKLRTLHNAGKHLLELVNGLLDLSKIESGRMELARRAFPLQEVIQSSAALVAPDVMRKKLEFTLNLDPRLPKSALGDSTRLRQVILNLLSNAVKFTPSGGSIYFTARQKEQERLRLEVRDTGPGISPENQRLIFKDFVQIASMTQSEALGTGLGLAITSRLVKQMGGEIGCQSNSGAGSTFWIEIPLVMAEMPEKAPEPPRPDPSMPTIQSKLHVLVVDDVKANRDVAGALLASLGHEVAFAGGGAEALEKLPTEQFDLVLLDLQMPQMDGFATARNIRAMPDPLGQVPIFALTASVMPDQIAAAQEAGMDGHMGKPLSREALAIALAGLRKLPADQAQRPDIDPEADTLPDLAKLDQRVLALLKSELKGAAAGVVREFIVEMQTIRDQLAAEMAQAVPRAEVIAQYAHRLLGAARTLGAIRLAQQVTEFQKLQPRDSSVLNAWNREVLRNLITEMDLALEALEAFFQAALVGAEVNP